MNKLFRNPRTRVRNLILVILPFIILLGVFSYVSYSSIKGVISNASGNNQKTVDYKKSIDSMGYYLRGNATDLQVSYFNELQDLINGGASDADIAACVAKNYVADFYTWSNKNGSYDVGGMYYVHGPSKNVIIVQARNTYYKYLTYYINTFGSDKLLEVTNVETEVDPNPGVYSLDGKDYECYSVFCRWEYKSEDTFEGMNITSPNDEGTYWHYVDFATHESFNVIKNDEGRFEIVDAIGDY
ncbi:MAG: hypothetical protein IKF68_06870 [Erysipelotrichaceae bacterium]|nr:hypothetical protein [Erysipelotrichaceae bacterium]